MSSIFGENIVSDSIVNMELTNPDNTTTMHPIYETNIEKEVQQEFSDNVSEKETIDSTKSKISLENIQQEMGALAKKIFHKLGVKATDLGFSNEHDDLQDSLQTLAPSPSYVPLLKVIGSSEEVNSNLVLTDLETNTDGYDPKFLISVRKFLMGSPNSGFVVKHEKRLPDGPRVLALRAISSVDEENRKERLSPDSDPVETESVYVDNGELSNQKVETVEISEKEQNDDPAGYSQYLLEFKKSKCQKKVPTLESIEENEGTEPHDNLTFMTDLGTPYYSLGNEFERKQILDEYGLLANDENLVIGHTLRAEYCFMFDESDILQLRNYEYTEKELSVLQFKGVSSRWDFRCCREERLLRLLLCFDSEHTGQSFIQLNDPENENEKEEQNSISIRELSYFSTKLISLILPKEAHKQRYIMLSSLAKTREADFFWSEEEKTNYTNELLSNPCKFLCELDHFDSFPHQQQDLLWKYLAEFSASLELDPNLALWKKQVIFSKIGHPKLLVMPISSFHCVQRFPDLVCVQTSTAETFLSVDRELTTYDLNTIKLLNTAPSRTAQNWLFIMHHLEIVGYLFPHLVHLDKQYSLLDYAKSVEHIPELGTVQRKGFLNKVAFDDNEALLYQV